MSRSVRLNNMHNWQFVAIFTPDESNPVILEETLRTLALRDEIMITGSTAFNRGRVADPWMMPEHGCRSSPIRA
ncbi:MAG: hypothetical protein HYX78_03380 [Armatimonadetes bacterium]|nr:hypothetical protein [Armatimonadota bacterium]